MPIGQVQMMEIKTMIHTASDTTSRHDIYAMSGLSLANKQLCAQNVQCVPRA